MPTVKERDPKKIEKVSLQVAKRARKIMENLAFQTTKFEGYLSGDHECFCLSKIPFEKWVEHAQKMPIPSKGEKAWWKWHEEHEALTLYPSHFFPKKCKEGRWKFTVSVQAEKIE